MKPKKEKPLAESVTVVGIKCPHCKARLRVLDSEPLPGAVVRRYRECEQCGYRVKTEERPVKLSEESIDEYHG